MRLFAATLATETNTFSPLPTSLDNYKECCFVRPGEQPGGELPGLCTATTVVARRRGETAALVFHRDHPGQPVRLGPHQDVRDVAVSPDGTMFYVTENAANKVVVFSTATNQVITTISMPAGASPLYPAICSNGITSDCGTCSRALAGMEAKSEEFAKAGKEIYLPQAAAE